MYSQNLLFLFIGKNGRNFIDISFIGAYHRYVWKNHQKVMYKMIGIVPSILFPSTWSLRIRIVKKTTPNIDEDDDVIVKEQDHYLSYSYFFLRVFFRTSLESRG